MINMYNNSLDIDEEMLQTSMDFEAFLLNVEASLIFKNKSLKEWYDLVKLPVIPVDRELSAIEIDLINQNIFNISEIILSNFSLSKSLYLISKNKLETERYKNKKKLETDYQLNNKKLPNTKKAFDELVEETCIKYINICYRAEAVMEFWKEQVTKLNIMNSRMTSLSIALHKSGGV